MNDSSARFPACRLIGEVDGLPVDFDLEPGDNTVGALAGNSICLPVPHVSRRHAVISVDDDGVWLVDLESKNGCFVNGVRVRKKILKPDDWIQFGPVVLTFEIIRSEERVLGVTGNTASNPSSPITRADGTDRDFSTELAIRSVHSRAWGEILNEFTAAVFGPEKPDLNGAVNTLARCEQSVGVAFLRANPGAPPVIEAYGGDPVFLAKINPGLIAAARPARPGTPGITSGGFSFDCPTVSAVHWTGATWSHALIGVGRRVHSSVGPILETALRILMYVLQQETPELFSPAPSGPSFPPWHVVGHSKPMQEMYRRLAAFGKANMPVLITGETGVGKEHIVRILHKNSNRAHGPLRIVNCTAIPRDLLEAELFGIERGVATGVERRTGKIRLADRGTLFLDEIGDMDPELQGKILRVLQEREVHPIGCAEPVSVDVRIVTATHADLAARVRRGQFREDLYFRISGCEVRVPALRERREDIPALVHHFFNKTLDESGKSIRGLSIKALEELVNAPWPGNVRQLQREIERLVALCPEGRTVESALISTSVLHPEIRTPGPDKDVDLNLKRRLAGLERRLIRQALEQAQGNQSEAARLLGVSRNGLRMKIGRLGVHSSVSCRGDKEDTG